MQLARCATINQKPLALDQIHIFTFFSPWMFFWRHVMRYKIKASFLLKRLQTTKIITRKSHSSLELENTWGRDATKIWSNQFFFFSLLIAFWLGPPTRTIKLIWVVDRVNFESALQTDWNSLHAFWRTIVIDKLFKETFDHMNETKLGF